MLNNNKHRLPRLKAKIDISAKELEKRGIKKTEHDSDAWPQGPYSDGGGEADYPQHCCQCHVFMENSLTSDGVDYVKHWIKQTPQSEVTKEWQDYYDYIDY